MAGRANSGLSPGRLKGRLDDLRRRLVVGREAEKALFRQTLDLSPHFALLHVYGPGGIGKTTLLKDFIDLCEAQGVPCLYLDARFAEGTPAGFVRTLGAAMELEPYESPLEVLGERGRTVLLLDTYERLAGLDDWLRDAVMPQLPAASLVVLAGRQPPTEAWHSDPAWGHVLKVISLRNLPPDDCLAYLEKRQVVEHRHQEVLALTYGHPLALSLMADVLAQMPDTTFGLGWSPDVLRLMLERFLREVPSPAHREALEICAHVRVTTEATLREALSRGDAHELFAWLRSLSFIEQGPEGLFPHDLARDVIDLDFRWRDPEGFRAMHSRARSSILGRARSPGPEAMRAIYDLFYLHRNSPIMKPLFIFGQIGSVPVEGAKAADEGAVSAICEEHLGAREAENARYWFKQQPDAFALSRNLQGEVLGFVCDLRLTADDADLARPDPTARAVFEALWANEGLRPGEVVLLQRFTLDKATKMHPSPVFNAFLMHTQLLMFTVPQLAFSVINIHVPQLYETLMYYIDHHPMTAIKAVTGEATAFAHDWRKVSQQVWFELMGKRELSLVQNPAELEPPPGETFILLSRPEFTGAVRRALQTLHNPEAFAGNPLLRSKLVLEEAGTSPPESLRNLIRQAAGQLRDNPKDEKFFRALNATFFEPAMTQELAAERLDLPFGTYRYQLAKGIERVAENLWQRELGAKV